MHKAVFVLLLLVAQTGFCQEEKDLSKKERFYKEYWENQEKKGQYEKIFNKGDLLFAQKKYYEAIDQYKKAFDLFPDDQQAIARIRDIEIILAGKEEESVTDVKRSFIPLEKLKERKPGQITSDEQPEKQLAGEQMVDSSGAMHRAAMNARDSERSQNFIEGSAHPSTYAQDSTDAQDSTYAQDSTGAQDSTDAQDSTYAQDSTDAQDSTGTQDSVVEGVKKAKEPASPKESTDYRKQLAKEYKPGLTETTYRKGNRTVTKRVIVKGHIGDEYLRVKHDWGGLYYFKNGRPITELTWDSETTFQEPGPE